VVPGSAEEVEAESFLPATGCWSALKIVAHLAAKEIASSSVDEEGRLLNHREGFLD
jgi:hypothetical protein